MAIYTRRKSKAFSSLWDPSELFANGENGAWYDPADLGTLFQNIGGSNPVTSPGQAVARIDDKSGNGYNATQSPVAARPTYGVSPESDYLYFDKVDDRLQTTLPAINGTMVLATELGAAAYGVSISSGSYDIGGRGGLYFPGNELLGQIIRNGAMTQKEIDDTLNYLKRNGGFNNYGAVTDFTNFWRNWSDLTSFPLIDTSSGTNFENTWFSCTGLTSFPLIDTSSGTSFVNTWRGCTGLTSFPLIDTSSGTNFENTWLGCTSLTSFPAIVTSNGTSFQGAWLNCTGLTTFPAIDTSSGENFSFAWQSCTGLTSFPLIDTSNGENFQSAWRGCTGLTSFPLIDTSNGTNFIVAWLGCTSLTSFPAIDTSSGENFSFAWFGCTGLTSFPAIDTSSGTNFQSAWSDCTGLTSFPANFFDGCLATNMIDAFSNTNLSQTSIDDILVSIESNGTSNGTFGQSGGSAPSATGEAAIDALRARGWSVTVTGGY